MCRPSLLSRTSDPLAVLLKRKQDQGAGDDAIDVDSEEVQGHGEDDDAVAAGVDKAFDFAQSTVNQLITLSTAVPTALLAFWKQFAPSADTPSKVVIIIACGVYALSVLAGLVALMAIPEHSDRSQAEVSRTTAPTATTSRSLPERRSSCSFSPSS